MAARKILANTLLVATLLCAANLLWVVIGSGISFEIAGLQFHSVFLEFPLITGAVSGVLYLLLTRERKEVMLLVASVIIAMMVAEVALRVIDHPLSKPYVDYAAWYRPSDYFGHELVPGFEGFGPLNVPVKINSHGFRDGEHSEEKPAGTLRVLGLGDSFMFGWGVSLEETFLKQLEEQIHIQTGQRAETINTGVPGWGLNQYYLLLKREDLNYAPDIIAIAYFVDDLSGPFGAEGVSQRPPSPLSQQQGVQFKGGALHYLRVFNFLKSIGHWVREKNRRARVAYLHDFDERRKEWSKRVNYLMVKPDDQADTQFKGYLRDYLLQFKHIASQRRAALVVMFIPDIAQLYHHETQYINGILAEMTQELDIPFTDMTPTFETSQDPSTYYLWPNDPHTNARGHLEMAKALLKLICEPAHHVKVSCNGAE